MAASNRGERLRPLLPRPEACDKSSSHSGAPSLPKVKWHHVRPP